MVPAKQAQSTRSKSIDPAKKKEYHKLTMLPKPTGKPRNQKNSFDQGSPDKGMFITDNQEPRKR